MLLSAAQVRQYKSIEDSTRVSIDPHVTVLVGQNESGKTAFLQALHKSRPVEKTEYNLVEDFPRKRLNAYVKEHEKNPAVVTELTYTLEPPELDSINDSVGFRMLDTLSFTRQHRYDGSTTVLLSVPEQPYIQHLVNEANLPEELATRAGQTDSIRQLISLLEQVTTLPPEGKTLLAELKGTFSKVPESWQNMLTYLLWTRAIGPRLPRFLYFDDYYMLPGKVNLPQLQASVERGSVADEEKTVLSLLRMAGIDLGALMVASGYESVKAKLEAISNTISDKVFEYWKQNQDLDVEFDIREDPHDSPPFNVGSNLYIRIRDRRNRVSVPFSQRSKGFVWFFSFIVWFDSIKQHLGTNADLILLLDEPGLSLHALAQADFLRYIADLSANHQILYSTHSPFMVPTNNLYQVRTVEAVSSGGSVISSDITHTERRTAYPLQAALGYKLAQNLFSGKHNLLVEGPADLVYLKYFSGLLDKQRKTALRDDITVVPMGGMGNLSEFLALLGPNEVELAILEGSSKSNGNGSRAVTVDHEREDALTQKCVVNYGMFRATRAKDTTGGEGNTATATQTLSSAIEDLLSPGLYLKLFNSAYKEELGGTQLEEGSLPEADTIRARIEKYLKNNSIQLRQAGGYDPYVVASYLAANPLPASKIDAATLSRFEQLFTAVNALYADDKR